MTKHVQTLQSWMGNNNASVTELKPFNIDAGVMTVVAVDSMPGPFVLSASRVDKFSVVNWDHRHFNLVNSGAAPVTFSIGQEVYDDGSTSDPFGMATLGMVGLGVSVFDSGNAQVTMGPLVEGTGVP